MAQQPAGWYSDPSDVRLLRYWDGAIWTEHTSPAPQVASPVPRRRRIFTFRTGFALTGIGIIAGVLAGFMLVSSIGSAVSATFFSDPCSTPCVMSLDLDEGDYLIFEHVGGVTSYGPVSTSTTRAAKVGPQDVRVQSSELQVPVTTPTMSETIDRNGVVYGGVVAFSVPSEGRYELRIEPLATTRVVVAPSLGHTFKKALPGAGVAALAGSCLMFGLVTLLAAWIRRSQARA